jgi:formylglycine-generating enzyme required for sulfatase activity
MAAVNPLNSSGDRRVFRGGSWYDPADSARCSSRHGLKPSFGNGFLTFGLAGFRLVKTN